MWYIAGYNWYGSFSFFVNHFFHQFHSRIIQSLTLQAHSVHLNSVVGSAHSAVVFFFPGMHREWAYLLRYLHITNCVTFSWKQYEHVSFMLRDFCSNIWATFSLKWFESNPASISIVLPRMYMKYITNTPQLYLSVWYGRFALYLRSVHFIVSSLFSVLFFSHLRVKAFNFRINIFPSSASATSLLKGSSCVTLICWVFCTIFNGQKSPELGYKNSDNSIT